MVSRNRQWILASRPHDTLTLDNFAYREVTPPGQDLKDGQVLVQNLVFLCAPTMRNWMNEPGRSYRASINLGEPIIGTAGAEVIASKHPDFPVGMRVRTLSTWEDFKVLEPDTSPVPLLPVPDGVSFEDAMGVYGTNSLAAYFGILRVGEAQPGETVVVSGAAGSTGSMAAQIARIHGCRVIGIAGGKDKCDWLINACGLHAAIDYKNEDVRARLAELCPDGVDVFFDNVGGEILQAVMDNIAVKGRVAVCGQIAAYDSDKPAPGPHDMMKVVYWRVRIQGFLMGDFADEADRAQADMVRWNKAGELIHREDIREGFENLPRSFLDLFKGANAGTLLVKVA